MEDRPRQALKRRLRAAAGPDRAEAPSSGYPRPATAIRAASSDHRCDRCGYQIATAAPFPCCPMCGTKDWKRVIGGRQRDSQAALM